MNLQDRYLERVDMREPTPSEMPLFISPAEIQKIISTKSGVKALRRFIDSNKTVYICSETDRFRYRTIKGKTVTAERAEIALLETDDQKIVVVDRYGEFWQLSELAENNYWLYFPPSESNPLGDNIVHDWRSYFKHHYHQVLEKTKPQLRKNNSAEKITNERELLSVFVSSLYEKRLKKIRVKDPLKYERLYGRIARKRAYFQVSFRILRD